MLTLRLRLAPDFRRPRIPFPGWGTTTPHHGPYPRIAPAGPACNIKKLLTSLSLRRKVLRRVSLEVLSLAVLFMLLSRYFPYFAFSALLFFIVPGVFVYQNHGEISHVSTSALLVLSFSLFLFSMAVLLLLHVILKFFKKEQNLVALSVFSMFYVFIAGLLFPVSSSSGLIAISDTPTDFMNLVIALVVTGLICFVYKGGHRKTMMRLFSVMVALNFAVAVYGYFLLWSTEKGPVADMSGASIHRASSTKNIFVVSFDGVMRDSIYEALQNNEGVKKQLDGFIFFPNVSSSSPSTSASIYAELLGNQNFKLHADNLSDFRSRYQHKLLTNKLDENGVTLTVYGVYAAGFKNSERTFREGQLLGEISPFTASNLTIEIFDIVSVKVFTRHITYLTFPLKDRLSINKLVSRFTFYGTQYERADLYDQLAMHKGPRWSLKHPIEYLSYDRYVDKLTIGTAAPVAHFMHYTFSHFPVAFDEQCSYEAYDAQWYRDNQSERGVDAMSNCVLLKINDFVDKVKALGIYEKSVIIFKSDHGKPSNYFSKDSVQSFQIHHNEQWGYSRYTPFLMIKPENSSDTPMGIDENAVLIDDLANTLCRHSGIAASCDEYPGYDLLADDLHVPSDAKAYYFVLKSQASNFKYDTHEPIELTRKKDFFANMHHFFVEGNTASPVTCKQSLDFTLGESFHNGRSDHKTWAWWKNKGETHVSINTAKCSNPYVLKIKSAPNASAAPTIAINGNLLKETRFLRSVDGLGWDIQVTGEEMLMNRVNVKIAVDESSNGDSSLVSFYPAAISR